MLNIVPKVSDVFRQSLGGALWGLALLLALPMEAAERLFSAPSAVARQGADDAPPI